MAVGAEIANKLPLIGIMRSLIAWKMLFYLRFFAQLTLKKNTPTIIGIAGSVGKSTARDGLYAVLKNHAPTYVVSGNSETGIPLGVLGLNPGTYSVIDWIRIIISAPFRINNLKNIAYLIVEMGIDGPKAPKNMEYLLTIIKPDISIVLNETPAHIGNYESILPSKNKLTDKQKLSTILEYMTLDDGKIITHNKQTVSITNADDPLIKKLIINPFQKVSGITLMTFGSSHKNTIVYDGYVLNSKKTIYSYIVKTKEKPRRISLTLTGYALPKETQSIFASIILTCDHVGMSLAAIKLHLEKNFTLPPGRGSILEGIQNTMIIDSSYNASKASVSSFINMVKILKKTTRKNAVFLFGDMKELGST
ncbi:Mur ligase family protein, partial [Patescibacteria group bacterium]